MKKLNTLINRLSFRFCFLISTALAFTAYEVQDTSDGTCIIDGAKHATDEVWYGNNCVQYTCYGTSTDNKVVITINGCEPLQITDEPQPGCRYETDYTQRYPDCCKPRLTC